MYREKTSLDILPRKTCGTLKSSKLIYKLKTLINIKNLFIVQHLLFTQNALKKL